MARAGWMPLVASVLFILALAPPAAAAPAVRAAAKGASVAAGPAYSFSEYRAYRIKSFERRRQRLAQRLADPNLPAAVKTKLEETKTYYDWLATMPAAVRDRRYRARFDRIDTDHDGKIDAAERTAWRAKERAYYRRGTTGRIEASASTKK